MQIHDVAEFRGRVIPPPAFYIEDILPMEGVMLLFGSAKVGKSWMSKQIGMSIATGTSYLGFRTMQAKVLIVQFEISITAYQWRIKQMMDQHYGIEEGLMYIASPGMMFMEQREQFESLVQSIDPVQPQVIILDCLQSCFGGDENDSHDIARFISQVETLKRRYRASIILVHHSRKGPQLGSFADLARGQSKLTGWPDTLIYMHKQPTGVQLQFLARQATRELPNINVRFQNTIFVRR